MDESDTGEPTDEEKQALHKLQLGIENLYRGHGSLIEFHHTVGRGMDHLHDAEEMLREAGHERLADGLRDEALPAGVFGGTWTYELVDAFEGEFLADVTGFEQQIRDELADGQRHITEREQQQEWQDRAGN